MSEIHRGNKVWQAGKPKKKPGYDAETVTKELLNAAVKIYEGGKSGGENGGKNCDKSNGAKCEKKSLRAVAEELETQGYDSINPAKVKKLLITAGVYKTGVTEQIGKLRKDGHTVEQIMAILHLSRAAVNNNLPYEKIVYKMDASGEEISVNADKVRLYKKRKKACEKLLQEPSMEKLWVAVVAFEGYPLKTTSNLPFTYEFKLNRHGEKGNELCVSRKTKTITRSSIETALTTVVNLEKQNADSNAAKKANDFPVKMYTPKELGTFGASYIYPLFIRFGLVEHIGSHQRGGPRKGSKRPKVDARNKETDYEQLTMDAD